MEVGKAARGFLLARSANGLSPHTLDDYGHTLRLFVEFVGEGTELGEIDAGIVRGFLNWLRSEYKPRRAGGDTSPLSAKSLRNHWIALSAFYTWTSAELGCEDVMDAIEPPPAPLPTVEPFTEEEVRRILRACEYTRTAATDRRMPFAMRRPTALRDRALVLLLLDTGIRASECARLVVGDVDLGMGEVVIRPHGSGAKSRARHVYLGKAARRALWRYLVSREDGEDPGAPLFVSRDGRAMTRHTIRSICQSLGGRAGVHCYPHRFRHTFAIMYLRNGGDVFTLQRLLGHSSLDMVKRYLALARTDDAATHRRASPADNWRL
jgi:integrase/recombinase XerD